jgi:hypothetical protein
VKKICKSSINIKNIFKKYLPFFIFIPLIFLLFIFLNLDLFKALAFNTVMPGWDGQAHLAIGKIYAEHIFPSTWGWINEWYLGMPFPQFYPPLFYFLIALLSKILFFIKYELVFRLFVFLSLILTPVLISFLGYKVSNNKTTAFLSGFISIIFLSYCGPDLNIGVGVGGTINTGLFANSLGFNFFVLWLINFYRESWSRVNLFFGVLFLACVFLTNVHLIVPALIFFIVKFIFDIFPILKKYEFVSIIRITFCKYFIYGITALGISAFWVIPMLTRYDYFSTMPLNMNINVVVYYFVIFSYLPFFFIITLINRRNLGIQYLTVAISSLAILVSLNAYFQFHLPLPLHVIRWMSPVIYLSAIPISDLFVFLLEKCVTKKKKIILFMSASIFIFISSSYSLFSYKNMNGIYNLAQEDGVYDVINFLKKREIYNSNNMTLIEANTTDFKPKSFVIDSLLGQNGVSTIFSNLRESSMSGLYLTPLRNLLSEVPESWGIQSFLTFDKGFLKSKSIKEKIDLASYFGISSVVTSNTTTTRMFEIGLKNNPVYATSTLSIFDIKQDDDAVFIQGTLIAVFSDITLNKRNIDTFSFSRISEEWLRYFDKNIVFVRPNRDEIYNNPIFRFSKIVILDKYSYENYDLAIDTIKNFIIKGGSIYIILNNDNDYKFLSDLNKFLSPKDSLRVHSVQIHSGYVSDMYNAISDNIYSLDKKNINNTSDDISLSINNNLLDINIKNIKYSDQFLKENISPILIKRSYFPDWKSTSGDVYLASPSFILYIPTKRESKLFFATNKNNILSGIMSLLSLISLFIMAKKLNDKKP